MNIYKAKMNARLVKFSPTLNKTISVNVTVFLLIGHHITAPLPSAGDSLITNRVFFPERSKCN